MEPIILPRISDQKPLVSVVSITYNHEPYIRDCLEGFLMQKTAFPIEIIIHDDASTDHTAGILREYYKKRPDLFHIIIEKENQYSKAKDMFCLLFEQTQGKYVALCEGDDYWIDPFKLQKQFEFMESHKEYSVCGTRHYIWVQSQKRGRKARRKYKEVTLHTVMEGNPFTTCTTFIVGNVARNWAAVSSKFNKTRWKLGDLPLFLYCMPQGKGYIMPFISSCYRVLPNSASHGDYAKLTVVGSSAFHIRLQLIKELDLPYNTNYVLKKWALVQVKSILKWNRVAPQRKLKRYWKIYWKKDSMYPRPFYFCAMFSVAYFFCVLSNKARK